MKPEDYPFTSGHCDIGRHENCSRVYGTEAKQAECTCKCHTDPRWLFLQDAQDGVINDVAYAFRKYESEHMVAAAALEALAAAINEHDREHITAAELEEVAARWRG